MSNCVKCDAPADFRQQRYFTVPGMVSVPSCYLLCDKHKNLSFTFEDLYNPDLTRKYLKDDE